MTFPRRLPFVLLVVIFGASLAGCGETAEQNETPTVGKVKNTPEQAVKALIEAARAEGVAAFGEHLGANSKAMFEAARATVALEEALNKKFGPSKDLGDSLSMKDTMDIARPGESLEIRGRKPLSDNLIALTIWKVSKDKSGSSRIWEETWHAVLEDEHWRIVFPPKGVVHDERRKGSDGKKITVRVLRTSAFDWKRSAEETRMANAFQKLAERATKEIQDGKYKSRREAEAALDKQKESMFKTLDNSL